MHRTVIDFDFEKYRLAGAWKWTRHYKGRPSRAVFIRDGAISLRPARNPEQTWKEFLAIRPEDPGALIKFLNKEGRWGVHSGDMTAEFFANEQQQLRKILGAVAAEPRTEGQREVLANFLAEQSRLVRWEVPEKEPAFQRIYASTAKDRLYAGVFRALAAGSTFRFCKRLDCPDHRADKVPFEANTIAQEYCCENCQHLELVRRSRKKGKTK
jgi:hypothetical protein